ncbi:MAG: ribulokinase [Rikenellaceae bacterium]|nr:ribulokinase [Rikenellaceae bacterium]
MRKYVIGIDYGTDSARAVLVDATDGQEIATSVMNYPRWAQGLYCDAHNNRYRQHPLDYVETLEHIVREVVAKAGPEVAGQVAGISFDTTGCTPVFTDAEGTPLALTPGFEENPNAMFVLWKDHTAVEEAAEINRKARAWHTDYTKYEGGIYSSEWVWAKAMHILREDDDVRRTAVSWVEHCDWMAALITGTTALDRLVRSRCAAGHKAMWHPDWGGIPPEEFLAELDPALPPFRARLSAETYTADRAVGTLTPEWAARLGLDTGVVVGVSAFDCHMGAIAGEITPGVLVRAIGTSTCDIMIAPPEEIGDRVIAGICGQVDGSVIPGYIGLEAGQSGFGDIYAWFRNVVAWPLRKLVPDRNDLTSQIIPLLSEEAAAIPVGVSPVLATDWMNGRRTPDANQNLTGTITGLTLASSAPMIFRALVEATAYGSRAIMERFRREGVAITGVTALGGVAKKSPLVMQTMADVLNLPIKVARTNETCATGAAMCASVAAGIHPTIETAQKAMGQGFEKTYTPIPANVEVYDRLYAEYLRLGKFTEEGL